MKWVRTLLTLLGWRGGVERLEREIDEEFRFHLEMRVEANLARGLGEEEAREEALRAFGDVEKLRAQSVRLLAGLPPAPVERRLLPALRHDARVAVRTVLRRSHTSVLAVAALGLGIAITTVVFALVDAAFFRPLGYPGAERLVAVWNTDLERGWTEAELSVPDYRDIREASRSLDLAAFLAGSANLAGAGDPERLELLEVTANFSAVLGFQPYQGRGFTREEEIEGQGRVTLLSHRLWTRLFPSASEALGAELDLDGVVHTVVGILPDNLPPPFNDIDAWIPLATDGGSRSRRALRTVGRLRSGRTLLEAGEEVSALAKGLEAAYPDTNSGLGARVVPFRSLVLSEDVRFIALVLLACAALVLVIAGANVVNLLLAGTIDRQRELAIRSALGASRWQIARQLLMESAVLGIGGGFLGLLVSYWGLQLMRLEGSGPLTEILGLSWKVTAGAALAALLLGLVVGLAPVAASRRWLSQGGLAQGGRTATPGAGQRSVQRWMVRSQVALAVVLLSATLMVARAFVTLTTADLGFHPDEILSFRTALPAARYTEAEAVLGFYDGVLRELALIPGVESAAAASIAPITGRNTGSEYVPVGVDLAGERLPSAPYRIVTPGYASSLGIPVLRGRDFSDRDGPGSLPVALVGKSLAMLHWPEGEAVGQRIRFRGVDREIVGVLGDVRLFDPGAPPPPILYLPLSQVPNLSMDIVMRVSGPADFASAIRQAVQRADPSQPIFGVETLRDRVNESLRNDRVVVALATAAAALALAFSLIGVYGILAHWVAQRARETGIRIALGARRGEIIGRVVGQGLRLTLTGAGAGIVPSVVGWWALSRLMDEAPPGGVALVLGAASILLMGGVVASFLPARRASLGDPIEVLREE